MRRTTHFDFESDQLPVDWFRSALFPSVGLTALTYLFPLFEHIVITEMKRSEATYADQLGRDLVRDFIGHEARHSRAHEASFVAIRRIGYRVDRFEQAADLLAKATDHLALPLLRRVTPRPFMLGLCAAGEHWTAELSAVAVEHTTRIALEQRGAASPALSLNDMELLFMWHALEEIEHRSVCFDAFVASGGTLGQRRAAFVVSTTLMSVLGTWFVALLANQTDGLLGTGERARRGGWPNRLRRNIPLVVAVARDSSSRYWRSDFHPGETDRAVQCALLRGLLPRDKVVTPRRTVRRERRRGDGALQPIELTTRKAGQE